MKCTNCGSSKFRRGSTEETFKVGDGRQFVVQMPATVCTACGDAYVEGPALELAEREIARRLAASGEPTGASFRFMRKALGIPAKTLAAELGIAAETISRWENGDRPVDAPTWLLLAGMVREPNGRDGEIGRLLRAVAKRRSGEMPAAPNPVRFELKSA